MTRGPVFGCDSPTRPRAVKGPHGNSGGARSRRTRTWGPPRACALGGRGPGEAGAEAGAGPAAGPRRGEPGRGAPGFPLSEARLRQSFWQQSERPSVRRPITRGADAAGPGLRGPQGRPAGPHRPKSLCAPVPGALGLSPALAAVPCHRRSCPGSAPTPSGGGSQASNHHRQRLKPLPLWSLEAVAVPPKSHQP